MRSTPGPRIAERHALFLWMLVAALALMLTLFLGRAAGAPF